MGAHQQLIATQQRIAHLTDAFKSIGVVTDAKDEFGNNVTDDLQRAVFALALSLCDVNCGLEDITNGLEEAQQ